MDDALSLVTFGHSQAVIDRFTVRYMQIHLHFDFSSTIKRSKKYNSHYVGVQEMLDVKKIYLMHKKVENPIPYHSRNLNMKTERPL